MFAHAADDALTLPLDEIGRALATIPESQWFERKAARTDPKTLAKALIGMANAEGGRVVLGVHDGAVEGMGQHAKHVNRLRRVPLELIVPPLQPTVSEVPVIDRSGQENYLLVFQVAPSRSAHQRSDSESFMRVGDSTIQLNRLQWQELVYDRSARNYEAEPTSRPVNVLDPEQLDELRQAIGAEGDDVHVLRTRSLLTPDGHLTIAALLLLGTHPQEDLPQALVRVLHFREDEAGAGARQTMTAQGDRRIEGSIPHMIREARTLIEEWAPKRRALREDGTFGPVDVIPRDVWLEALVNAVVHRSYSMSGDHIRVSIFPHRIEVSSPGRFPGLADPSDPLHIDRYARNPRIARVCSDLGITQELGEGIRRMVSGMRDAGLGDPQYRQTSASVIVTLDATTGLSAQLSQALPKKATEIVQLLRNTGPLGTGDIATAIDVSRPTVLRGLKALQEQGLVTWSGSSPKDPRALWSVPGSTRT